MDKLRNMEVMVAVVEAGSFAAAARQLQISAVMVGKHIQQLEAHLGARLFQRSTRQNSLTEVGAAFYEDSKRVLEQVRWAWLEAGVALAEGKAAEAAELCRRWLQRLQADDVKPYAAEWVARLAARLGEAELSMAVLAPDGPHLKSAKETLQNARNAYLAIVDPAKSPPLAAVLEALARCEKLAGRVQQHELLMAQAIAIRAQHR